MKNSVLVRGRRGAIIPLFLCLFSLVLAGAFGLLTLARVLIIQKAQNAACDAAALEAARQLSRIVVSDPYYGYIALTDYPPTGKGTLASDGQPLPVLGVNTILAAARVDLIVARELGDAQMLRKAELEYAEAQRAAKSLQEKLSQTLKRGGKGQDLNGVAVAPYESAMKIMRTNLNDLSRGMTPEVRNLSMSLGWLDGKYSSCLPSAQPLETNGLRLDDICDQCYAAGRNLAVDEHSFYFAAMSPEVCLASPMAFHPDDKRRFCSVVKVSAEVSGVAVGSSANYDLRTDSCALPPVNENPEPHSILVLHLPHGLPACATSLSDLMLCPQASCGHGQIRLARGGDYGKDQGSALVAGSVPGLDAAPNTSQLVATVLFDWIAAARGNVQVDSLKTALYSPLTQLAGFGEGRPYIIMEIDANGAVSMRASATLPFNYTRLQENQALFELPAGLNDGVSRWTLTCFDNMAVRGSDGGKHCGQPLTANSLNWCELPAYGENADRAVSMGRGGKFFGISLAGASSGVSGGISEEGVILKNGREVNVRKSYYSGGLAGYIELVKAVEEVPLQ